MFQKIALIRPLVLASAAAVFAFNAPSAYSALLAYDSFTVGNGPADYKAGNEEIGADVLGGQNPATGPTSFYAGAWVQAGGDTQAVKDIGSLAYPMLPGAGGQVQETLQFDCCTFGRTGREIAGGLGSETRTIYQSFLIDFGTQGTDDPAEFGKRAYEMWNGAVDEASLAVDLSFNHFAAINELTLAVTTASGTQSQVVGGGLSLDDLAGTNFFVLKFDFNEIAADVLSIYLNPTDSIEANYSPVASIAVANSDLFITHHGAITNFTFSGAGHIPGAFDEVRWGDTFLDVTPFVAAPEPGTLGLLAMTLAALAAGRRGRRSRALIKRDRA